MLFRSNRETLRYAARVKGKSGFVFMVNFQDHDTARDYLRVTHPFATHPEEQAPPSAFYLHVLGTPPAFILSQDQTLIKIIVCLKLILSLTDLLFFYCSVTITSVIAPCTLVRLVQFSKVFVALARQLY